MQTEPHDSRRKVYCWGSGVAGAYAARGGGARYTPLTLDSASSLIGFYEVQASLVTVVSSDVSNVVNRIVGGANPLVQATAGARPVFESAGWGTGGKDSLQFDGVGEFMTANGLGAAIQGTDVPFTMLLLGQLLTLGSAAPIRSIWGFGDSVDPSALHDFRLPSGTTGVLSSGRRDSAAVSRIKDAATALTTNRTMWSLVFDGTKVKLRTNGILDTNLDGVSATADSDVGLLATLDSFSLGALARAGVAGFVNFRLAGMLLHSAALTDTQLIKEENYLEQGHPL